jgi:beta-N-acetylhexosaminidase
VTINDGSTRVKGPTLTYREEVDAALIIAEVVGYGAQNNYRIVWKTAMSNECPWYVWEVPTFMVSHNYTTHLHDATMVKCYINAYHSNEDNVLATIDKMEGRSEFTASPITWSGPRSGRPASSPSPHGRRSPTGSARKRKENPHVRGHQPACRHTLRVVRCRRHDDR